MYFSLFALVFFISFIGGLSPNHEPHHIIHTLLFLICFDRILALVYPRYNHVIDGE